MLGFIEEYGERLKLILKLMMTSCYHLQLILVNSCAQKVICLKNLTLHFTENYAYYIFILMVWFLMSPFYEWKDDEGTFFALPPLPLYMHTHLALHPPLL